MCVIKGYKDFYIVNPFESKFLYPGQVDGIPKHYCPVDFQFPNLKKYPDF